MASYFVAWTGEKVLLLVRGDRGGEAFERKDMLCLGVLWKSAACNNLSYFVIVIIPSTQFGSLLIIHIMIYLYIMWYIIYVILFHIILSLIVYVCIRALTAWLTCKSACHSMRNLCASPGHLLPVYWSCYYF